MKKYVLFISFALAGLVLAGCNDDGYSLGDVWVSMATVENPDQELYFYFTTDGGERMWAGATTSNTYRPKDGQRILAYYTILSDGPSSGAYDHDVQMKGARNVLAKDAVIVSDEAGSEALGNDPVGMRKIWVGGGYVNFDFIFVGYNKAHTVNLARNDTKTYDDGKLHLEFRHNANEDGNMYDMWALASLDPRAVMEDPAAEVDIVIHYWVSPSSGTSDLVERTFEVKYSASRAESGSTYLEGVYTGEVN